MALHGSPSVLVQSFFRLRRRMTYWNRAALPAIALVVTSVGSVYAQDTGSAADTTTPPPSMFDVALDAESIAAALARGANVNETGEDGETVLMLAAEGGDVEAVKALLTAGANPNLQDSDGEVALGAYLERLSEPLPVVEALLERGANPSAANEEGVTPLMYASRSGSPDMVEALIKAGADPNQGDNQGDVPLGAYIANHPDPVPVARVLLANGASRTQANASGITPQAYAERWGSPALKALLRGG